MSKTVLITGIAGSIGSTLAEKLIGQDYSVVGIDNFNDYYSPTQKKANIQWLETQDNFSLYRGDLRDETVLKKIFSERTFDTVIHLAARAGVRPSLEQPQLYWDVNIIGSLKLLEQIRFHNTPQFIFASSSSVYGSRKQGPFKETDDTNFQVSPYGATKKSLEVMAATYAHLYNIKTTGLRFFTVYGPRNRPDMACYLFTDAIYNDRPITMFGDGTTGRDYTYIEDIVIGIIKAIETPLDYEIINLGNSTPLLLKDMIATIEKTVGKKATINQQPIHPGDVPFTFADTSKAKQLLNWQAETDFETGIKKLFEWYKNLHQLKS